MQSIVSPSSHRITYDLFFTVCAGSRLVKRSSCGSSRLGGRSLLRGATRYGTLSATARALRVNHATVARRVTSLETVLGRALFERCADGYALTVDGKAVEASAMDEAALSVLRRLDAGTEPSSLVRLTAGRVRWPPSVGRPGGGIKLGPVVVKPPVAARSRRPRRPRRASARRAPNAGAVSNKI
jgi:Bacterial regulatory helix-turn-helix protein, lysR family